VIGHPWHDIEIGHIAARNYQLFVRHATHLAAFGLIFDLVRLEVDVLHFFGPAKRARQELAQRHNHVQRVNGRADHFCQQWAEDEMILAVEQDDLNSGGQVFTEDLGAFDTPEPASNDNDTSLAHVPHNLLC
jgi:hypothetical protein